MKLSDRQKLFAINVAKLIFWAYQNGYEITFGDAYRDQRVFGIWGERKGYGHPKSNHKRRCAIDLNLFDRDAGTWLTDTEDHRPLGEYWESLHPNNRWGGRYNDGNHYEILAEPRA